MNRSDAQETDKALAIAAISAAFAHVVRDDGCTLHQAHLADESMSREISQDEWMAAARLDKEHHWRDVAPPSLDECLSALSHLTPTGWHFYLPAFMLSTMEMIHLPVWKTDLPGSVVFHLTYPAPQESTKTYNLERFERLSEQQVASVALFLRFVVTHASSDAGIAEDAQVALNRYWGYPFPNAPSSHSKSRNVRQCPEGKRRPSSTRCKPLGHRHRSTRIARHQFLPCRIDQQVKIFHRNRT